MIFMSIWRTISLARLMNEQYCVFDDPVTEYQNQCNHKIQVAIMHSDCNAMAGDPFYGL